MNLVFVDCEAFGGAPSVGRLTEFGAVSRTTREAFHGIILNTPPDPANSACPMRVEIPDEDYYALALPVYVDFDRWLAQTKGRSVFVSDNPAYDWQWINDGFWKCLGKNPFGFSARRIGDFYAGLRGDFYTKQDWKLFRKTPHDHNPVHDAVGNLEAFDRLLAGEC